MINRNCFLLLVHVLIAIHLIGQQDCNFIPKSNLPFVWEVSPFDETLGDTTCAWSQGGEHFYGQFASYAVNQDSLYMSFPTYIKYYNIEGGLIQKIDINKGKILWQTALDLRNNDRQEQLQSIKFSKMGIWKFML